MLYWLAQIFGAIVFGYSLDFGKARRTIRAKASFVALTVLTFVIWGGGWAWQRQQAARDFVEAKNTTYVTMDWTDGSAYIAPMFLFIFMGFFDAAWQTCIYWYVLAVRWAGD